MRAAKFFAQVYDANFGERTIGDAGSKFEQVIFSFARVVIALERRSSGAEQRDGTFQARAINGGVAAVIARRFFLFVAGFLFFVHDDEAEIFEGRENGGARADDYASFTVTHAPPFAGAFDIGQTAVQDGDLFAEASAYEAADPEGERDFGDQDDGRFAAGQGGFDRAEIDFGLAAAGDAVEQGCCEFFCYEPAPDFCQHVFLFLIEDVCGRSEIGVPGIFFGGERFFPGLQAAGFFQARDDGARDLGLL